MQQIRIILESITLTYGKLSQPRLCRIKGTKQNRIPKPYLVVSKIISEENPFNRINYIATLVRSNLDMFRLNKGRLRLI